MLLLYILHWGEEEEHGYFWFGEVKDNCNGVRLIIKTHKNMNVENLDFTDPRIIAATITVVNQPYRFVRGYGPTGFDNSKNTIDLIYHQLQHAIKQQSVRRENILGVDLNEVSETPNL